MKDKINKESAERINDTEVIVSQDSMEEQLSQLFKGKFRHRVHNTIGIKGRIVEVSIKRVKHVNVVKEKIKRIITKPILKFAILYINLYYCYILRT